jgi:hypothetical protein
MGPIFWSFLTFKIQASDQPTESIERDLMQRTVTRVNSDSLLVTIRGMDFVLSLLTFAN